MIFSDFIGKDSDISYGAQVQKLKQFLTNVAVNFKIETEILTLAPTYVSSDHYLEKIDELSFKIERDTGAEVDVIGESY